VFGQVAGSAGNDQQAWQIRYEELQLDREIGQGSFGTVSSLLLHYAATPLQKGIWRRNPLAAFTL
jgi:hypothetical protein